MKRIESLGEGIRRVHQSVWKRNEKKRKKSVEKENGFFKFIERQCGIMEGKVCRRLKDIRIKE